MRAIQIQRTGGPEGFEYFEVATSGPGPTEVLVRADTIGPNMPEAINHRTALRLFSMHFDHDPEARHACTADLVTSLVAGSIQPVIFDRIPLA